MPTNIQDRPLETPQPVPETRPTQSDQRQKIDQSKKSNKKPQAFIVGDSNIRRLKPPQIKPDSHVTKFDRFTIEQATNGVPQIENPEEVKDIVFNVDLNDLRGQTVQKF